MEDVFLTTPDQLTIHSWLIKQPESFEAPTIIFFHGNAGNIAMRLEHALGFYKVVKANIFLVSYRGYGISEGKPSEEGLKIDAQTALDYLCRREDLNRKKIFVFGGSIGGAVAIHLAQQNQNRIAGLLLENTFTSLEEMVAVLVPILTPFTPFLKSKWSNRLSISEIQIPILFISGRRDELVPSYMMDELYRLAVKSQGKKFMAVAEGKHNNTWNVEGKKFYLKILEFINSVLQHNNSDNPQQLNSESSSPVK